METTEAMAVRKNLRRLSGKSRFRRLGRPLTLFSWPLQPVQRARDRRGLHGDLQQVLHGHLRVLGGGVDEEPLAGDVHCRGAERHIELTEREIGVTAGGLRDLLAAVVAAVLPRPLGLAAGRLGVRAAPSQLVSMPTWADW